MRLSTFARRVAVPVLGGAFALAGLTSVATAPAAAQPGDTSGSSLTLVREDATANLFSYALDATHISLGGNLQNLGYNCYSVQTASSRSETAGNVTNWDDTARSCTPGEVVVNQNLAVDHAAKPLRAWVRLCREGVVAGDCTVPVELTDTDR